MLLAGDWRVMEGILKIARRIWEVGVAGSPVTAGFHWWRSGNITRMQNVSEYMLLLALCLV